MDFSVLGINRHRMLTDGKGITTLVALAGCPLACPYCINKELLGGDGQVEKMTPKELVERLAIDHCYFIYTEGGVTFGGGEPLLHSRQIREFASLCPKEWHITIETSLNVSKEQLQPLLNDRFSFIIDVKAMQPKLYQNYTGKENRQVIHNLEAVQKLISPKQYVVKIPVIPEYSGKAEVEESVEMLKKMNIPMENILSFAYQRYE